MQKYLNILVQSTHPSDKNWGYLPYILIGIASIIWPISWIYSNQNKINFAQVSMVRGIVCIIINYVMCRYYQTSISLTDKPTYYYLNLRCFLVTFHGFIFGISQFILPLPIIQTLNCSGTLLIFLIDFFVNGIKINSKQALGISVGILGTILATNGQLIIKQFDPSYQIKTKFQNYITEDPIIKALFSLIFLCTLFLWAYGTVLNKKIKANTFQNNFVFGVWMLLFGAIVYPYIQSKCTKIELFISIFTTGIPLAIVQFLFIASLTMTKNTGVLNMMTFVTIFVAYLISIFRYGQNPNFITIFGIVLVFFGVYRTIFNKDVVIK